MLVDEVEPQLGRGKPVFLTDYPARMASLARLMPDDPATPTASRPTSTASSSATASAS